jgi:purine-binding chemotaxis protein CheW
VGSTQDRRILGIVVDAVYAVVELSAADIAPPPDFGANICRELILGIAMINDKTVVLLDLDHVLSHDELNTIAPIV